MTYTLEYTFNGEDFYMDVDIKDYVNTLSNIKLRELCKDIYDDFTKDSTKELLMDNYDITSSNDFFKDDGDSILAMKELISETDEDVIFELLKDDIEKYYRADAYDSYLLSKEEF